MSSYVDDRIVQMQFDNRQFESNVQTSMGTLDKLKQTLSWTEGSNAFSGIGNAVETVREKFSALEIMGVTALTNITNSAVNAGKRIVSALTIQPIKSGFSEYELKMNSVQTIMAGTGESLETVNKYLEELNTYADKTIYSFSDMTSNIGKFTNAGVKLDEAVSAIQGVSNVAAISGANANEASRAMYNFAQALSAGYVKLIDWKSIENANMATVGFKEELIKTAVEMGTLVKVGDKYQTTTKDLNGKVSALFDSTSNFNEALSAQWMTTDVLVKTLKTYSDETTELGKKAFAAAQDVKTFSQLYDTLKEAAQSGWAQSWEIIVGDFEEAKTFLTEVNNIVGEMLNKSAESRNTLLKGWKDSGGRAALIDSLRNSFEGLMSVITPISEAFREIFPPITVEQLVEFTNGIKDLTSKFKLNDEASENLKRTFKGLFALIDGIKEVISSAIKTVLPFTDTIVDIGGAVLTATASMGDWLVQWDDAIKKSGKIKEFFDTIKKGLADFVKMVKEKLDIKSIGDMVDKIKSIFDGKKSFSAKGGIFKVLQDLRDKSKLVFSKVYTEAKEFVGKIAGVLGDIDYSNLLDIGGKVISGGIGINIIKFLQTLTGSTVGIQDITEKVSGILSMLKDKLKPVQEELQSDKLLKIAAAIGILALSVTVIASIDSEKMTQATTAISILFAELVGSMAIMEKIGGSITNSIRTIGLMLGLASAIAILAGSLKTISKIEPEKMISALTAMGALMAMLAAFSKTVSANSSTITKGAGSMVAFAAGILIMASACKSLAKLKWDELARGLLGLGAVLVGVSVFLNKTDTGTNSIASATGILILSAALKVMASACKSFAKLEWDELARGLIGMAGALGIVTLAVKAMPSNLMSIGAGLVGASAGVLILSAAFRNFGKMSWEEFSVAMIGLAGSLSMLAIALNVMVGTASGSAALLIASAALAILAPVIKSLGEMTWEELAKGLIALAGAFTVIGVAGAVLTPIVPSIVALAGALVLVGAGVLAVGAGVAALGAGLTAIVAAVTVGATSIVTGLNLIISEIANLIPYVIGKIGEGIISFADAIAEGAPKLGDAAVALSRLVIQSLTETIPELVEAILKFVQSFLSTLAENAPSIIQSGIDLSIAFLNGIRDNICQIVPIVVDILLEMLKAIAAKIPDIIQAGVDIVVNLIDGLATGIEENAPRIREAFLHLFKSLLDAVLVFLGIKSPSKVFCDIGINIIKGLIEGIKKLASSAVESIKSVVSNLVSGVKGKISEFVSVGKNLIEGLKSGIKKAAKGVISAAKGVVSDAISSAKKLLGIKSPSKVFEEIGKFMDLGWAKGINKYGADVSDASSGVGQSVLDGMKTTLLKIPAYLESKVKTQPKISPVVDLTNVEAGASRINGLFSSNRSFSLAGRANISVNETLTSKANSLQSSNEKVAKIINGMQDEMKRVTEALGKYKVVMDSGALVGQMVAPMDSALGTRAARNWREREV